MPFRMVVGTKIKSLLLRQVSHYKLLHGVAFLAVILQHPTHFEAWLVSAQSVVAAHLPHRCTA